MLIMVPHFHLIEDSGHSVLGLRKGKTYQLTNVNIKFYPEGERKDVAHKENLIDS
jgi:hypothetical protein